MSVASCECGETRFEVVGAPIVVAACHCDSCVRAAAKLALLAGAASAATVLDEEGGVPLVLVRKDRVTCASGFEHLRAYRLTPKTKTRRTVARCCNTPMFIDAGVHWLSFFRDRLGTDAPPVEMRVNRASAAPPRDAVPSSKLISVGGMWRIARAWASMRFRIPKLGPIEEASYPEGK